MFNPMASHAVIVMGVCGSGKTTVSKLLAARLNWQFADADSLHPQENVLTMRNGIALADEDRWPWLKAIAAWTDTTRHQIRHGIVACPPSNAPTATCFEVDDPTVRLVYLKADPGLVKQRMTNRRDHFMPTALLQSQFDAPEEPQADENPICVPIDASAEAVVATDTRIAIDGSFGLPMRTA